MDSKDPKAINAWGEKLKGLVQSNLLSADGPSGIFLDSCNHHCGAWGITIDGDSTAHAHMKWYNSLSVSGAQKLWDQTGDYPCAACCKIGA